MRIVIIVILVSGCTSMLEDMGRVACYYAQPFAECRS